MNKITTEFLKKCKEVGYTEIGINCCHGDYMFYRRGYACGYYLTEPKINGWPAIWNIKDKMKIGFGASNGHSFQIPHDTELETGLYDLSTIFNS